MLGRMYHEAGTLGVETDASNSVADTNHRFHHTKSAHCSDRTFFVTEGSVNSMLPGLTLTLKVTEAVVARAIVAATTA